MRYLFLLFFFVSINIKSQITVDDYSSPTDITICDSIISGIHIIDGNVIDFGGFYVDTLNWDSLYIWYDMNPNGASMPDLSGNSRNGTIVGATETVEGMWFDGINDYINMTTYTPSSLIGTHLMYAKIEIDSLDNGDCFFGLNIASTFVYLSYINTTGYCAAYYNGGFLSLHSADIAEGYVALALTFDGSNVKVYVNGVAGAGSGTPISLPAARFQIGGFTRYQNFECIDYRYYNRVLTANEIGLYSDSFVDYAVTITADTDLLTADNTTYTTDIE